MRRHYVAPVKHVEKDKNTDPVLLCAGDGILKEDRNKAKLICFFFFFAEAVAMKRSYQTVELTQNENSPLSIGATQQYKGLPCQGTCPSRNADNGHDHGRPQVLPKATILRLSASEQIHIQCIHSAFFT